MRGPSDTDPSPPPPGTVERWAWDFVCTTDLALKLAPPAPPEAWEPSPPPRRLAAPGRPPELEVRDEGVRAKRGGLRGEKARARLFATFLHHELQAAELMAWALLAFPETPRGFREGLCRVLLDEARHMRLYRDHMARLGFPVGSFPVRDWFWERVPQVASEVEFVAVLGMGFEGGNLDHAQRFADRFRAVGDEEGARIQEQVGREEIAHVRFAVTWFERWTGGQDFDTWRRCLPEPLSPMLMRGPEVRSDLRRRAGQGDAFVAELSAWSSGS